MLTRRAAAGCSSMWCLGPDALLVVGGGVTVPDEDGIEHGPRHSTSLAATGTGTAGGDVGRDADQKRKGPAAQ